MLATIKEELLNQPDKLKELLECFGYVNIRIHERYMSFGRDEGSSAKSIVIWLVEKNGERNKYLYVKDYARGVREDLFTYIINQRGVTFSEVMAEVRNILDLDADLYFYKRRKVFGGIYDNIRKETPSTPPQTYDKSLLDAYPRVCNRKFLDDGISLKTQKYFDLRFDIENDGIVIPVLDQFGNLMGIKERVNHEIAEGELKYWYPLGCQVSKTLYGYALNYNYLSENTVLIFEAEKSVMQCHSFGIRNAVALGSGAISRYQIKMLYEVQPREVLFLHDYGYDMQSILKNAKDYGMFGRFSETRVGYWDWTRGEYDDKYSPSDLGKDEMIRIIREEIVYL